MVVFTILLNMIIYIKSNFYLFVVEPVIGVVSWQSSLQQLVLRHKMHGCISSMLMVIYVNLTYLGLEPSLPCQKARTLTT